MTYNRTVDRMMSIKKGLKKSVLARDGNCCQSCGAFENLETYQYVADRSYRGAWRGLLRSGIEREQIKGEMTADSPSLFMSKRSENVHQ